MTGRHRRRLARPSAGPTLPLGSASGVQGQHGLIDALAATGIGVVADSAYRGAGANVEVPQRRRARAGELDERPRLSTNQKAVNAAHARLRGPGERANAQLKAWKIFRKIRTCPHHATLLVNAVQALIHAG